MLLGLMLAALAPNSSAAAPPQRVSERLYYLDPYQAGVYSCDNERARRQQRAFDRRFRKRIAELKRKDIAVSGPDPGFDAIALGRCSRNKTNLEVEFNAALQKFDAELSDIEREFR